MKKNNKGFMLVELIITSTVIVAALIGLYTSYSRIYSLYQEKNTYYNIDGVYATKEMINDLLETGNLNSLLNQLKGSNYIYIIDNKNYLEHENYNIGSACTPIKNLYHVNKMILVEYDKNTLNKLKNEPINETFKEYIDYVIKYYGIKENDDYNYIVLTEIEIGNKQTENKQTEIETENKQTENKQYNYSNLRIG